MTFEKISLTQSELERRFLDDCTAVGLLVIPQFKIGKIHADFAIPERKIAIEIDSKQYHSTKESAKNDDLRNEIYLGNGWNVIRILGRAVMKSGERIALEIKTKKLGGRSISWIFN